MSDGLTAPHLALIVDRVRYHFFGAAFAVHFRGVDQRHAELDTQTQRRHLLGMLAFVLAHPPGPLTQRGNAFAIEQCNGLHLGEKLQQFYR